MLRSCADGLSLNVATRLRCCEEDSSRCYCWTELLQKEEMVAKEHPLSPLLWLEERMLDCNTGEKRGYCNTGRITAGELVSGGGREKGDCDGAKNPTRGGILVSS